MVVVIIIVMLRMVVICHGSLANSQESYFHKVGLCHKDGNAVMMMIVVMREMTMMNVMMLILVLTWSIQQAAEARSEYTAGKPS